MRVFFKNMHLYFNTFLCEVGCNNEPHQLFPWEHAAKWYPELYGSVMAFLGVSFLHCWWGFFLPKIAFPTPNLQVSDEFIKMKCVPVMDQSEDWWLSSQEGAWCHRKRSALIWTRESSAVILSMAVTSPWNSESPFSSWSLCNFS